MSLATDDELLRPIFLKLPPDNIVTLKFTLESYEGLGILRTINPQTGEVVVLALQDTVQTVEELIDSVADELSLRRVAAPENANADWLMDTILP